MKNTQVDVIIPTFNSLPWLEEAIDSVLDQTHSNLKLIVVDDGSTDETEKFMNSLRDNRVTYLKKDNAGVSSARNMGIANSNSKYIAFLDADDYWSSNKLEEQLKVIDKNINIGLVYGHHYIVDEDNIIQGNNRYYERGYLFDKLLEGNIISGSASMSLIRRSTLEKAGGYFNEDLANGEDWDLWLRIAKISEIDFVPKILAYVRNHNSNSQLNTDKMSENIVRAYEIIGSQFKLTLDQKRRLASTCLYSAAVQYRKSGNYRQARKILFMLFKENPPAYKALVNWKIVIVPGEFMKIIFSSKSIEYFIKTIFLSIKRMLKFARRIFR